MTIEEFTEKYEDMFFDIGADEIVEDDMVMCADDINPEYYFSKVDDRMWNLQEELGEDFPEEFWGLAHDWADEGAIVAAAAKENREEEEEK